jgi:MoxR-like ATPase
MQEELAKVIVGQDDVIEQLFAAIFTRGHCLLVGVPGLAKTLLVSSLAKIIDIEFKRIQFTPDLMPSDITGTNVLEEDDHGRRSFRFMHGPVFTNILLADEINRTPPKTQAALLQAMQEREVTVGQTTYALPDPFFTIATQNPIEQEGTYPLPEAQLDRFLLHVLVDYPDAAGERAILTINRAEQKRAASDRELFKSAEPLSQKEVLAARLEVLETHLAEPLEEYLVQIVLATRHPARYGDDLKGVLQYGASPRATIALDRCARACAWLAGRDYVTPEDVQSVAHDILRHRILLSFEAEAAGRTPDELVDTLLARIGVP